MIFIRIGQDKIQIIYIIYTVLKYCARAIRYHTNPARQTGVRNIAGKHNLDRADIKISGVIPDAVSGSGHNGKQIDSIDAVIHVQESPPQK